MSIRLVRANSDTPNVLNSDDARIMRFASCYNGITKNYANECAYQITGSTFKVKSGEIIIDGWQAVLDGNGAEINVVNIAGIQYYKVYAKIDLSNQSLQVASIESTYDTYTYPTITKGDDLTNISGVARLELYRFTASNGVISNVVKLFKVIVPGVVAYAVESEHTLQADNAINADSATNSVNASMVNNVYVSSIDRPELNKIQVIDPHGAYGYIERIKLLFDGENSKYNYLGKGVLWGPDVSEEPGQGRKTISLIGAVSNGDLIEIIGELGTGYKSFRGYVFNNQIVISDISTQEIGSYIGPYIIANQLTIVSNSSSLSFNKSNCLKVIVNPYDRLSNNGLTYSAIYLWKIYKILGGIV